MPRPSAILLVLGIALLIGCGDSGPLTRDPALPDRLPAPAPNAGTQFVGLYQLTIDPATLRGSLEFQEPRSGQFPQAQQYDIDPAYFLKPDSLEVEAISRDLNGDVVVSFIQRHPFPAPDLSAPSTPLNRCDLGYTGRLVILADLAASEVPSQTFFGDRVVNTELVVGADGYVAPGNLLTVFANETNTFPYVLLADEAKDNRVGVANGGPSGSYDPLNGGWQRGNLGASGDGWTGYDYIHAGQSIRNSFTLSAAELQSGPQTIVLAVLAKYTQPKGVGGPSYRFPPVTSDVLQFAYRLPYAALDASVIQPTGTVTIEAGATEEATVALRLRDWDALALESVDSDLSDETDPALIQTGAAGAPLVELDCPLLSTTPFALPEMPGGTGLPGEELEYEGLLVNALGTAPAGNVPALLRITDPEVSDPNASTYHSGIDAVTLIPDPARAVLPVTYQALSVTVEAIAVDPPVIVSVDPIGALGAPCSQISFSAVATNSPTDWSWDFGGGATPNTSTDESPMVELLGAGSYLGTVTASNAGGASAPFDFSFSVATPSTPSFTSHLIGAPLNAISFDRDWTGFVTTGNTLALAFNRGNGGPPEDCCDTYFAQSSGPSPASAADWTVSAVDVADFNGQNLSMLYWNGLFLIAYNSSGGSSPHLRVAMSPVAQPAGESDWVKLDVDDTFFCGWDTDMDVIGGFPAISHGEASSGDLRYTRALTNNPMTVGDWQSHIAESAGNIGADSALAPYLGGVAISHRDEGTGDIRVAISATATPGSPADWTGHLLKAGGTQPNDFNGSSTEIAVTGGRLGVTWHDFVAREVWFALANVEAPAGPSDWTAYALDSSGLSLGGDVEMITYNGRLALSYMHDSNPSPVTEHSNLKIARALTCAPTGVSDWTIVTADPYVAPWGPGFLSKLLVHNDLLLGVSRTVSDLSVVVPSGVW